MPKSALARLRRENDGRLPSFSWPGAYPFVYLDGEHNLLCPACANMPGFESPVVDYFIHWDGAPVRCDHCYTEIESACGEPDPDEEADHA